MANQSLVEYIKNARAKKTADETISQDLQTVGWSKDEISQAFIVVNNPDIPVPSSSQPDAPPFRPDLPRPPHTAAISGTNMWYAFEHILMFISLYVLASALTLMLEYFIDHWFPRFDPYGESYSDVYFLRTYLSALIVATPLFGFFYLRISKKTTSNPHLKNLHERKFLIYVTLTGTFIIFIVSIIMLVYQFINGNVTVNLFLKLLTNMLVSGIIFGYYVNQVKDDRKAYSA